MYIPPALREDRPEVLGEAVRLNPLGTLITSGPTPEANLLPFLLEQRSDGPVLHAHLARANPQVAALATGAPVLVLFHGPQAYISPSWYPAKSEHGRVVPTWNYIVVETSGTPVLHDDTDWLGDQIARLTDAQEAGRPEPWTVSDAPPDYITAQLRGIVGLEIRISQMTGKWKTSRNQSASTRKAVAAGLRGDGAGDMAARVEDDL